jgi:predicted aspartyl protease
MRGFTITSQELLTALGTPCEVSQAFHPASGNTKPERIEFNACWDTGASKSVITPRVVEACGLKPLRRIKRIFTQGVDGLEKSDAYEINLSIPGKITIHELTVVSKNPGNVWWHVLIGMDLISQGEFSIKNVNGKTEWSFSIPHAA